MKRRSFLRRVGVGGTVAAAGCLGGGGEVVASEAGTVTVDPYSGWVEEIPDVSDDGGTISYTAECDRKFDVYFFTSEEALTAYEDYVAQKPAEQTPSAASTDMPKGDQSIGQTATEGSDGRYRAATDDGGARQAIDDAGPYYFVLDNSNYPAAGGAFLDDPPEARWVDLDLTVTEKQFSLPV
jgi:hypothetical protein